MHTQYLSSMERVVDFMIRFGEQCHLNIDRGTFDFDLSYSYMKNIQDKNGFFFSLIWVKDDQNVEQNIFVPCHANEVEESLLSIENEVIILDNFKEIFSEYTFKLVMNPQEWKMFFEPGTKITNKSDPESNEAFFFVIRDYNNN